MLSKFMKFLAQTFQEYIAGITLPRRSPHTILVRMTKASHINPLKPLVDGHDHLSEVKNRYQQEALKDSKNQEQFPWDEILISDREADRSAAQKLEEERVMANVIGLTVFICVHFSKGDKKFNEPSLF